MSLRSLYGYVGIEMHSFLKVLRIWTLISIINSGLGLLSACEWQDKDCSASDKFNEPTGAYQYSAVVPPSSHGFRIVTKSYMFDPDPAFQPSFDEEFPPIRISAAAGEYEPATFMIYALRNVKDIQIVIPDDLIIKTEVGQFRLPRDSFTIRRVVRTPVRSGTRKYRKCKLEGHYLALFDQINIPAGEFREFWLTLHTPSGLPGGSYSGLVQIKANSKVILLPLVVQIYRFSLVEPKKKKLGIYYNFRSDDLAAMRRSRCELVDILQHGIRNLYLNTGPSIVSKSGHLEFDISEACLRLDLVRDVGFNGTIIISDKLDRLSKLMGVRNELTQGKACLPKVEVFMVEAKKCLERIRNLANLFPEFRLAVTHLDEVFAGERLSLFIALSKAVRLMSELPIYITFHTLGEKADTQRRKIDPFVDIRCNHGYSFEWWLSRGHTFAEYREEIETSSDEAWFYHNWRGGWVSHEWLRVINGVYLWASCFDCHIIFAYQREEGNPLDETDGIWGDGNYAWPDPERPGQLISTRRWECVREGYDDLRYIATLQSLVKQNEEGGQAGIMSGQKLLEDIRALFTDIHFVAGDRNLVISDNLNEFGLPKGSLQALMPYRRGGGPEEAPIIRAISKRFTAKTWTKLRSALALEINKLCKN